MAKKTAQEILALATGINEPQVDWVPLWKAPFFCFSDGYITSPNEWKRALLAKVQQGITSKYPIDDGVPPLVDDLPPPEWSFSKNSAKAEITIRGMGITTIISPQGGFIFPGERFDIRDWHIAGSSNDMFKDSDWHRIRPDERTGARWHRRLLLGLFGNNFVQAVKLGTVHIMARKNSALAAFERITWDQWQFFRLDEKNDRWPRIWYDPRELYLRDVPDAGPGRPANESTRSMSLQVSK
jgi:hypothetical protein